MYIYIYLYDIYGPQNQTSLRDARQESRLGYPGANMNNLQSPASGAIAGLYANMTALEVRNEGRESGAKLYLQVLLQAVLTRSPTQSPHPPPTTSVVLGSVLHNFYRKKSSSVTTQKELRRSLQVQYFGVGGLYIYICIYMYITHTNVPGYKCACRHVCVRILHLCIRMAIQEHGAYNI